MVLLSLVLSPGGVVAWLIIGLLAGAIAGRVSRGRGYGCLGDIVLGLIGALLGGFIISFFVSGKHVEGFLGTLGVALVGAIVLILGTQALRGNLFK